MTTPPKNDAQSFVTLSPSVLELELEALTYDRYWRFALLPSKMDYGFCRHMGTARLQINEFKQAHSSFPIVFFNNKGHVTPHAVLGLAPTINLAVTHKNEWRRSLYLPKEFQLYPFGLIQIEEKDSSDFADSFSIPDQGAASSQQKTLLGIVPRNPLLVPSQNEPYATQMFQHDGSITPYVSQILQKQASLKQDQIDTAAFISSINANNLLVERSIRLHFKDGTSLTLDGFSTISKTNFDRLSPTTLERWKSQGYLDLIELHLKSQGTWSSLITLHIRRLARDLNSLRRKSNKES